MNALNAERAAVLNSNSKKRKTSKSNSRPVSASKKKEGLVPPYELAFQNQKIGIPNFGLIKHGSPAAMMKAVNERRF
jgi:hypothetical protein